MNPAKFRQTEDFSDVLKNKLNPLTAEKRQKMIQLLSLNALERDLVGSSYPVVRNPAKTRVGGSGSDPNLFTEKLSIDGQNDLAKDEMCRRRMAW